MRRLVAALAITLVAASCAGGGSAPITILVDYSHDQFASFIAANFPREVSVHPGAELVFKQTWTGEPHTVTGGTYANKLLTAAEPFIQKSLRGEPLPNDAPKEIAKLQAKLPKSYYDERPGADNSDFNQSGAQPCYLVDDAPPTNGKPCKRAFRTTQPEFTGTQTFYNSGLIPYEGPQGNEYRVKLADDIKPGAYWFYCNVHGEFQSTKVVVKPSSQKVDTPSIASRRARTEINSAFGPILKTFQTTQRTKTLPIGPGAGDVRAKGNFAGLIDPKVLIKYWHSINEFVPSRIRAKAGQKITWNLVGFHTISFGVPKYFPVITFAKDGSVHRNKKLDPPAGGGKTYQEPPADWDPSKGRPVVFDGGTYDGKGFWSSGALGADPWLEYSMRITKPGTYRYACLIHPPMVGTVVVTR